MYDARESDWSAALVTASSFLGAVVATIVAALEALGGDAPTAALTVALLCATSFAASLAFPDW